ncbi:MAG: RNase adapter RapZ [Actinomycetales bacterium]|jgi:RNase adapter protein RapZ|nr:RNase adapter RapZ [Actinomycetales bacterium]
MSNELLLLTGMSGAGRSTVAHALEDSGWYVVDNLPPALVLGLVQTSDSPRIAVVVDVRTGKYFDDLSSAIKELRGAGVNYRMLFLDASDQALVQRFESTRRPHPLQGSGRIVDGITKERVRLEEFRADADQVIDTSNLNVHQLEKRINEFFKSDGATGVRINVLSFGYKYGIPVDSDLVLDCRFIPNPHWVPELRPKTGQSEEVSAYVLSQDGVKETISNYSQLLKKMSGGYLREGKKYITLAVGCTGGKHRSVAIAEELAKQLSGKYDEFEIEAHAVHRDVGRE